MRRTSKSCHYYQCGLSRRPHRVGTSVIKNKKKRGRRREMKGIGLSTQRQYQVFYYCFFYRGSIRWLSTSVLVKWMYVNWVRPLIFHLDPIVNFVSATSVLTFSLHTPLTIPGPLTLTPLVLFSRFLDLSLRRAVKLCLPLSYHWLAGRDEVCLPLLCL